MKNIILQLFIQILRNLLKNTLSILTLNKILKKKLYKNINSKLEI